MYEIGLLLSSEASQTPLTLPPPWPLSNHNLSAPSEGQMRQSWYGFLMYSCSAADSFTF